MHRLIAASLGLSLLASPAFAAQTLAKVDTKRLFEQYREAQASQGEFKKKAEEYQKEFLEKNRILQDMQREGKSKAEIEKATRKYEAELKPKKDAVEALDKEMSGKLRKRIEAAIQTVAKAKGFAVVVDKQVVLYGGDDITEDVLKKLNR